MTIKKFQPIDLRKESSELRGNPKGKPLQTWKQTKLSAPSFYTGKMNNDFTLSHTLNHEAVSATLFTMK
ncbi:hypothetical protein EUGRSUZ_H00405 [Eucalyptus grandis]|uniref:Uncharacterized protein n=2 Tax=Eucalyptus grandis TaxID=71139 RepID=A0ACC3JLM9_EUCGR|nr:hypothetical protein EUGRSUZ_H00405 [Eucalyptus grandis]